MILVLVNKLRHLIFESWQTVRFTYSHTLFIKNNMLCLPMAQKTTKLIMMRKMIKFCLISSFRRRVWFSQLF